LKPKPKLADVGEDKAINTLIEVLGDSFNGGLLDKLDDAAALHLEGVTIIKVDGTSERASKYPWMGLDDLTYRVLAGSALDIIAKGGRPRYTLISLGMPKERTLEDIRLMGMGIREFAQRYGVRVLGGDFNASEEPLGVWIDVTMLGEARKLIRMRGAQAGDKVYVTSCLGRSAIPALMHYLSIKGEIPSSVKEWLRRPEVPLSFLRYVDEVKATTDISDGLRSVSRFLKLNSLSLTLSEELPICSDVVEFAEETGIEVEDVLRFMGEEYAIIYVCNRGSGCGNGFLLGQLTEGSAGKVLLNGKELLGGWDNFRGFTLNSTE